MNWEQIETMVREDFEQFTRGDIEPIPQYYKRKHIALATQLVEQAYSWKECYSMTEVRDFIHGLNHLFFLGEGAGWMMMED